MNKQNLELLGLDESATLDDINRAYDTLRAKYLEDRFKDGEAGNEAAKMLTRIETAYTELKAEFVETSQSGGGNLYTQIEDYLKDGNLAEAQRLLDGFNERGAHWHYLQSVVYYRKNWVNESKKQLEIAIQLDPENAKYKETYRKLNEKINYDANSQYNQQQQTTYQGQTMNSQPDKEQMGGNFCANCIECCYINLCINCLCSACCR